MKDVCFLVKGTSCKLKNRRVRPFECELKVFKLLHCKKSTF